MDGSIAPEQARALALGDRLTRLLDARRALEHELHALDGQIYEELVNRLQSQIGAVLAPLEAHLDGKIARLAERLAALEALVDAMHDP